ncbi:MAG: AraC family transcriptional regulator [Cyclobacteriaceae bacterium]
MNYKSYKPEPSLNQYIREYWVMNSEGDQASVERKIIPDGFPELILHFGDPYEININGHWEEQNSCSVAGQIRKKYSLRNTGHTAILGIKLQPAAVAQIFNLDMSDLVDQVIPLPIEHRFVWESLINDPNNIDKITDVIAFIEEHLKAIINVEMSRPPEQDALDHLVNKNGSIDLEELCQTFLTNERKLARYFKSNVGLSPKVYSRILRFAHIIKLLEGHEKNWAEISNYAELYDQADFINSFKDFTGEEPSNYGFSQETMATFFLKT